MRRTAVVALTVGLVTSAVTTGTVAAGTAQGAPAPREVMFVGTNRAGTASVVDARTHAVIRM